MRADAQAVMHAAVGRATIARAAVLIIAVLVRSARRQRHALVGAPVALLADERLAAGRADRLGLDELEIEAG
jgi:hypothetical protein